MGKRVLFLLILMAGCESREVLPVTAGKEYFPVRVKAFWEYDVVETVISQVGGQSNSLYQLRIQVSDSITDSGVTSYILQRSSRPDGSSPWTSLDTWSVRVEPFAAVQQEGNISFVKLQFPLSEGKSWNGNAFNNRGGGDKCTNGTYNCEIYLVRDLNKRFESASLAYDNSVTIVENDDNDPIVRQDVRKAVYVKSIGLVYRESSILSYCTVGDCVGKQIIENGTLFKQTLKTYGGF